MKAPAAARQTRQHAERGGISSLTALFYNTSIQVRSIRPHFVYVFIYFIYQTYFFCDWTARQKSRNFIFIIAKEMASESFPGTVQLAQYKEIYFKSVVYTNRNESQWSRPLFKGLICYSKAAPLSCCGGQERRDLVFFFSFSISRFFFIYSRRVRADDTYPVRFEKKKRKRERDGEESRV